MDVRDPVHGHIGLSDQEVAVLDSQAYQRLRAIKQLGFSEFSFPGATHNRFLHSLGSAIWRVWPSTIFLRATNSKSEERRSACAKPCA